jgi:hypothetical protein
MSAHLGTDRWRSRERQAVGRRAGRHPGDAALLKLDIVQHRGSGIRPDLAAESQKHHPSKIRPHNLVLRLTTRGACSTAGELRAEPYSADYLFLR